MRLDAIELVEKDGHHFLVDVNTCQPIGLSEPAFVVLSGLKKGRSREELATEVGEETVRSVLSQLGELQARDKVAESRRPFRREALEYLEALPGGRPFAVEGILMVSQQCNLACRYCYGGTSGTFGQRGTMTPEVAERCFRWFLALNPDRDFQKILFLGGEPLLNMPVIQRVVELWKELRPTYPGRDLFFSTTTNGTTLTPEIARFLSEEGIGVSVSIDGPAWMHDANRVFPDGDGSFDRVMAGVELLRHHDIPFNVRTTMTRQTDVDELFRFFEEHDFQVEYLIPVDFPLVERETDYQLDVRDFRRLTEAQQRWMCDGCTDIKDRRRESFKARQLSMAFHNLRTYQSRFPFKCTAGWGLLAFDIDGTIYPCQRFVGQTAFALGDMERGLDARRVAALYRRFLDASRGCDDCWAVHLCRRRCFHQKARPDGSFEEIPEPVCDVYRDNYAASMVFARELQRFAREHEAELEDVLGRYDTERLMREFKASRREARNADGR